jgi:hypothetical protein
MANNYNSAGADAATDYAAQFQQLIANDPDIQRVIQGVWGNTPANQRPSDTPDHLEDANDRASKQITQILKSKGIQLPDRTFVNPRSGALEGHRGWSGLSGLQKGLIAGGAAAGGLGLAGALGAFGGLGAAGGGAGAGSAGASGMGAVSSGLGGLSGAGAIAAPTMPGGSMFGGLLGGLKNIGGSLLKNLVSGNVLDAAGRGLGAISGTSAHNRGVALDAMMAGDEMKLAAAREQRAGEADAIKNMQIAQYLKSGGQQDSGPGMSVTGKPLGKFDFGVRPATEAERTMGGTLESTLQNRLKNPMQLSDYASKMEPGKMESVLNWLGPIASIAGAARGAGQYQMPVRPSSATQTPEAPPTPEAGIPQANPGRNPWENYRF